MKISQKSPKISRSWSSWANKEIEKNLEQRGIEVMAPILVEQSGGNLVPEQVDESTGGRLRHIHHDHGGWSATSTTGHHPDRRRPLAMTWKMGSCQPLTFWGSSVKS